MRAGETAKPERSEAKQLECEKAFKAPVRGWQWCQRCERSQPTMDAGETCAVCKLVLP